MPCPGFNATITIPIYHKIPSARAAFGARRLDGGIQGVAHVRCKLATSSPRTSEQRAGNRACQRRAGRRQPIRCVCDLASSVRAKWPTAIARGAVTGGAVHARWNVTGSARSAETRERFARPRRAAARHDGRQRTRSSSRRAEIVGVPLRQARRCLRDVCGGTRHRSPTLRATLHRVGGRRAWRWPICKKKRGTRARRIVRAMPNTPCLVGKGANGLRAWSVSVTEAQAAAGRADLFAAIGDDPPRPGKHSSTRSTA